MRKIVLNLVAVGVLFCAVTASKALTVYVQTVSPTVFGADPLYKLNDWTADKWIVDDGGTKVPNSYSMYSLLVPQTPGGFDYYDATPKATPTFGTIYTLGQTAADYYATYTNVEAWYGLEVYTQGDPTVHDLVVKGKINGWFQYTASSFSFGGGASWQAYELYDVTTGLSYTIPVANPNPAGVQCLVDPMMYTDGPVNLYVEISRDIPTGYTRTNQATGVITTVPEPSALGMLFGSGVVGSLMFWRRRRNAA